MIHKNYLTLEGTILKSPRSPTICSQANARNLYGIPLDDLQASRKFKRQVTLYFKEDENDVEDGYRPTWGEISFKLMSDSSTTITKTELITLSNKIKT